MMTMRELRTRREEIDNVEVFSVGRSRLQAAAMMMIVMMNFMKVRSFSTPQAVL